MFSRIHKPVVRAIGRTLSTTPVSALDVFKTSCYSKIDFKIPDDATARDAAARFTAFNIGCLAVTDASKKVVGVVSERDYINKVASLGKKGDEVKVREICTYGPQIIVARNADSVELCMSKMMYRDIRHLLVIDDKTEECLGMISIKDLIKKMLQDKNEYITRLSFFQMGKGAYFGSE
jgi:CBS domain-containing protein